MKKGRLILKKESFGGIFVDTSIGRIIFLRPEEYEPKRQELLQIRKDGQATQIIDVRERGYPLLTDATSTPNGIFWEITKRCNGACIDCFMDSNSEKWGGDEVNFEDVERVARQFSALGGYFVRLTGGEPTTRADFFDIVDLLNEESMIVSLNTNGFFDERKLEGILSREIKDIRISVDGPESVNDSIRGKGSYKKAIRTIGKIAEYNREAEQPVQITMNLVLMKRNIERIEEMIELAQVYGSKVSFGLMRLTGRAQKQEMLSPEEVVQVAYRVQHMRSKLRLPHGAVRVNYDIFCDYAHNEKGQDVSGYTPYPFDNSKCPLGGSGFTLDAFARIVPCGYLVNLEEWVGEDIRNKDLLEVWYHSDILNRARRVTRSGCNGCGYHMVKCNGGCPVMAHVINEDISGRDPYCIRNIMITEPFGATKC